MGNLSSSRGVVHSEPERRGPAVRTNPCDQKGGKENLSPVLRTFAERGQNAPAPRAHKPGDGPRNLHPEASTCLESAYEHCRQINKHYGKTYYFSTLFFPQDLRPAVHALYAWVRYPDEWVDNPGGMSLTEQADKLRQWRDATADAVKTGDSDHPVLAAWADSARRYEVPVQYMRDFMDAMEMDLTVTRYQTFDDLQKYTWGSASVVGLMMCHLIGATDPKAIPHATSLGLAMQLTNFLRDVGEDWRDRGRIYLPLEDLEKFGVSEDDIASGHLTGNMRELVRFEAARCREIYAHSDEGMHYIPASARLPVRLARVLYSRILEQIERNDCDVFTCRACVPTWEKLMVLAQESAFARRI